MTEPQPAADLRHRPPWAALCLGWFLIGLSAAPWVVRARTYRALIGRSLPVSMLLGAAGLALLVWGGRGFLRRLTLRLEGDLVSLREGERVLGVLPAAGVTEFQFHPANLARLALLVFVAYLGIDGVLRGRGEASDRLFEGLALVLPLVLALLSEIVKRTLRREFWVATKEGGSETLYLSRGDARQLRP